jgi:beta-barrel assembly-enhancing protease
MTRMNGPRFTVVSVLSLFCLTALLAFAQGPARFHPGFNLFSKEQDVQLGQESAAQVRKQMTVIKDPVLTAYVNKVGKRLAASQEAQESGFPFTFEVVADPSINAFALPGGPMFINTGLLKAVDNEAQLAGVMGHEMSHVILRHGTNQASKAQLFELPALLSQQMGGSSMLGQLATLGIGLGTGSVLLKFSRSAESQADLMGSHLMAEAGYNPLELAHFFEKLNTPGGRGAPEFLSDHPNPDNREKAIEAEAARLPARTYSYQTGDFSRVKQIATQIKEPPPKPQPPPAQQPQQ